MLAGIVGGLCHAWPDHNTHTSWLTLGLFPGSASVADHPLVFATLTAPSFGKVHLRRGTVPPVITAKRLW